MIELNFVRQVLQFAVPVYHTNCAPMVSFRCKQFNYHLPMFLKPFGIRPNYHAFCGLCGAGWEKLCRAFNFHKA